MRTAKRLKTAFGILLAFAISGLCVSAPAMGAKVSLELSPPVVDLQLAPGLEQTFDVVVTNATDSETVQLKVYLTSLGQDRSGAYEIREETTPWSAVPWLECPTDQLTLAPRRGGKVTVTAKVPRGASGSRSAALVFEVLPPGDSLKPELGEATRGGTVIRNQLITVIKLTATSRANRKFASIAGIKVSDTGSDQTLGIYGKRAVKVACTLVNEGDTILAAQGRLLIWNEAGRRVQYVPLGSGRGVVLPGATVDLVSIFPDGFQEGNYTAEVAVGYGGFRPLSAKTAFTVGQQALTAGAFEAAATVRLLVEPEGLETRLPPGAFRGLNLVLTNLEKVPVKVDAAARHLQVREDGEFIPADEPGNAPSAAEWVKFPPGSLRLEPGQKKNLRVSINVPKGQKDGSAYAAVVLEAQREAPGAAGAATAGATTAGATTSITTPLVVHTGQDFRRAATLEDAGAGYSSEAGGVVIGARLENRGNTHFGFTGKVLVRRRQVAAQSDDGLEYIGRDRFDDLATLPLGGTGWVLPGESVPCVVLYDGPLESGEYEAEMVVEYGGESPVTAKLRFIVTPRGEKPAQTEGEPGKK